MNKRKILIIPYSRKLPNNIESPKNYPFWQEVVNTFNNNNFEVYQLIFGKDEPILNGTIPCINYTDKQQHEILKECETWISVDTFFQHLAKYDNKPGIVLWSLSNPEIFGYKENLNLFKSKEYFVSQEDTYLDWMSIAEKYKDRIKTMNYLEPAYIYDQTIKFIINLEKEKVNGHLEINSAR